MSDERPQTHEQLKADLSARLGAAIAAYAKERGLTLEEVTETARKLLLTPSPSQGNT